MDIFQEYHLHKLMSSNLHTVPVVYRRNTQQAFGQGELVAKYFL